MNVDTASVLFHNYYSIDKYKNVNYTVYGERQNNTDVSIMIPTYKRHNLLKKAVQSALFQKTKYSMEIVIVDNDPETDELEITDFLSEINDSRICYIRNDKNIGMFGNWNRCIGLSNSDWLIILNDDDELSEDYIENMLSYAISTQGCKAMCCRHHLIDDNDVIIDIKEIDSKKNKVIPISMKDMYLIHPVDIMGCLINRSAAISVGGFDEIFFPCSDTVFLLHICSENGLFLNTEKVFRYRWAVNESQKPSTRIDFAKFHILKSIAINNKNRIYGRIINRFIINAKCDYWLHPLIKEKIISDDENTIIRSELDTDRNYSRVRRFIFRVIVRLYTYSLNGRKDELHGLR